MTFVSSDSTSGSTYTSPSLSAGDLVVLVASHSSPITVPTGWQAAGSEVTTPTRFSSFSGIMYTRVLWRRATSAGTLSASFSASMRIQSVVLDGPNGLVAIDQRRINAAQFVYPGVSLDDLYTGHVLHVGSVPGTNDAPGSGGTVRETDTVRVYLYNGAPTDATVSITEQAVSTVSTVAADDSGDRIDGWAQTLIFATVAGPDAPEILRPLTGTHDLAAGFTIEWEPVGEQTGFSARRRLGAGAWYWWNGTNWTTATAETIITSTATTLAVAASAFANASSVYDIEVATKGDATRPELGTYATVTVTGKAPPTLSSAVVSPLSGSNLTSLTPAVTLSGAAGSGGTFTGYRVRIDQDAGSGWVERLDSGVVSSPWTVSVAQSASLANGLPTRFRSVAVQDGTQEGATTTSATYTMAHPTPGAPVITVTEAAHPASGLPGFEVTVTSDATGMLRLYRNGMLVYENGIVDSSSLVISDWTVGSGDITYTGTVTTGDGLSAVLVAGPVGTSATVALDSRQHCWIFDPIDPSGAIQAHCADLTRGTGRPTSVYRPLGETSPTVALVRSLPPHTPGGWVAFNTDTADDADRLTTMLTSGRALHYRLWPERASNSQTYIPQGSLRFYPVGDVSEARLGAAPISDRVISVGWVAA